MDVLYTQGPYWVLVGPYGWPEVWRDGARVCIIGYAGNLGFALSVWYVDRLNRRA